jgi:hypothetical protein
MESPRPKSSPGRREQRSAWRRRISARCFLDDGAVERHSWIVDLGPGGARVATAGPPPEGHFLRFELGIGAPARRSVWTRGRVVWCVAGYGGRGGLMGLAFDSPGVDWALDVLAAKG